MEKAEIINTEIEEIQETTLDKMGEVIEKIENAKQTTAIKQIEATDRDNERQYQAYLKKLQSDLSKWNKSFIIGSIASSVLGIFSIYLIVTGEKDLGIGLLASTFSGVFGFIAGAGSCNNK
ncbi:hypothetical protein [Aliarcobacter butzleri]|uniref:hypothetical protein n=1 Tax=Aliarcobacter butzleri TaxID=28197 RepID=UPI001919B421|nr:hypothetical protein [Aliarcobacter butzleri]